MSQSQVPLYHKLTSPLITITGRLKSKRSSSDGWAHELEDMPSKKRERVLFGLLEVK